MIEDEFDLLAGLLPLPGQRIIELGCGAAALARALLLRHPDCQVTGVEVVDARQHAKNLAAPQPGLQFVAGVAQDIAFPDANFDLALMLKSLHHVPVQAQEQALDEVARVLRMGGHLYLSEPVYDGDFNTLARLYNDEGVVRAAAQATLDAALRTGCWRQRVERHFVMPVHFKDFADFRLPDRPILDAGIHEVHTFADPVVRCGNCAATALPAHHQEAAPCHSPSRFKPASTRSRTSSCATRSHERLWRPWQR